MSFPFFLYENQFAPAYGRTVSASTEAAGFPASNTADGLLSTRWQSNLSTGGDARIIADAGVGNTMPHPDTLGLTTFDLGGATSMAVAYADDPVAGPWISVYNPAVPLPRGTRTHLATWTPPVTAAKRAWSVVFLGVQSGQEASVGGLRLGRRLDFPEGTNDGIDPDEIEVEFESNRYRDGTPAGAVVKHVRQPFNLRLTDAGIIGTWFDPRGDDLPSWDHFVRSHWTWARPWHFAWDLEHRPGHVYWAFPDQRMRHRAPFFTGNRRRLNFRFHVLPEGYMAAAA